MTKYIMRHVFHLIMFALFGVGLVVGSTHTDSQPDKSAVPQPLPKCGTVDASALASPPPCYVKKGQDEIVWENRTEPKGVYMCVDVDSKKDPFEAYAWYIPQHEQRHTGMVRQDVTPDPNHGYDFYSSPGACTTRKGSTPRNTPHVIVQ